MKEIKQCSRYTFLSNGYYLYIYILKLFTFFSKKLCLIRCYFLSVKTNLLHSITDFQLFQKS